MFYLSTFCKCFGFIILHLSYAGASKPDYIIVDGIEVHKDDVKTFEEIRTYADEEAFKRSQIIDLEYDLQKEEDPKYSRQFPNNCQGMSLTIYY